MRWVRTSRETILDRMRCVGVRFVCAVVAVLACTATAQQGRVRKAGTIVLADRQASRKERAIHDVKRAELRLADGRVHVTLDFVRPLKDGVFTRVVLFIDTDNDSRTGLNGIDLQVSAWVGSRYRWNGANALTQNSVAPFETRGSCYSHMARTEDAASKARGRSMVRRPHKGITHPKVSGRKFAFSFPMKLLRENGFRYSDTIRFRIEAHGTICEEPVSIEYICRDKGDAINVDGRIRDWPTTAAFVQDQVGELHDAARSVDLRRVLVTHDKKKLYTCVRLAAPGFGYPLGRDADIRDRDTVTLAIEPVGDLGYMKFREIVVRNGPAEVNAVMGMPSEEFFEKLPPEVRERLREQIGAASKASKGVQTAVRDGLLEVAIERRSEQTRFRVIVWTDAHRVDLIPDAGLASLKVPKSAWKDE